MNLYRYKYPLDGRRNMIPLLPEQASCILEVGCARGGFAQTLRAVYPSATILGCEPDAVMFADAKNRGYDTIVQEAFPGDWVRTLPRPDLVVFNDVLEHMIDPWEALVECRSLLQPGGHVVASTPNVRHLSVLKMLILQGDWRYRDYGILDRTHLRFFTRSSMVELFSSVDLKILRIEPVHRTRSGPFHRATRLLGAFGEQLSTVQYGILARRDVPTPVTATTPPPRVVFPLTPSPRSRADD